MERALDCLVVVSLLIAACWFRFVVWVSFLPLFYLGLQRVNAFKSPGILSAASFFSLHGQAGRTRIPLSSNYFRWKGKPGDNLDPG